MGAAIAGGVGVGIFKDFSIGERLNPTVLRLEPNADTAQVYRKLYPLFEASYTNLKDIFRKLGE